MNIGNLFALNGKIETEALSVVGIQYAPIGAQTMEEVEENATTLLAYIDQAVSAFPGVDIVVFPEACIQGFAPVNFEEAILEDNSPQLARIQKRCKDLSVWGVFNLLIWADSRRCYENKAFVVNDNGEIVYSYVKMNPWIPFENSRPGASCGVCQGPKGSRLGIIICADGDYPEIWREAAYNGANIIIRPTHYMEPWQDAWEITNKAGAYFNQVYVVAVNTSGMPKNETRSCFGRSMILGPDGNIITEASNGNVGFVKADLYPGIIDKIREQAVHSNPMFSFRNRGASCPDFNGKGEASIRYNAYGYKGGAKP
ncbi:MAG: nitrilase-related carbon-nitrogen hydrolase [Candidatus Pelethousia sp.]|nr:nitrilase-related carbon-nitrogen hydrolase [Candidatus Pelethousia sp.]